MNKPKMIIFDYGQTLLHEPDFDLMRGTREVFKHVVKNPDNITAEQMMEMDSRIFAEYNDCRSQGFEIHEWQGFRFLYEYLRLELDISIEEAERIMWENTSEGACMPHVKEMLAYLKEQGIRCGVISNIGWSGKALTDRINRLLPENEFEFVIASSEYGFRKPNPLLFELALKKADLPADEVWYCGDNIQADVYGAHSVGIFPVLYEELTIKDPRPVQNEGVSIDFPHLHIHSWQEMIRILDGTELQQVDCVKKTR